MSRPMLPALCAALIALAAPASAEEASSGAAWRYGHHPQWGLSAFVTVDGESIGLRCMPDRGVARPAAALALTAGLVRPHPAFTDAEAVERYRFLGDPAMGEAVIARTAGGYFERAGTTCEVNLSAFQAARLLLYFDEGTDVTALDDDTAEAAPGVVARIPLTGAKEAIGQLVQACPAIRKDIDNECGI
ncbi:hypothetical protein [Blastochloris viridis]|uniref:Uncharacterized protein n=2 Tax=Blastochloris viridis TaxID=1079 RepID=A0A0P0JLZ2_BLAVI|nr:hypothetical protein [Blastochloris viridis]ALK10288.1 hypothetical protein BVIR_2522 [Blastochloris viridis]CUU42950.1 hypothetical protein BVIRIDIS_19660 [Blastochloris viridis]